MAEITWRETRDAPKALLEVLNEYITTEFAGLLDPVANMTRLVRGDGGVAAHWLIHGTHGTPESAAQPSGASGPEFLGWQPTGKIVDIHVASFSEDRGPVAAGMKLVHEWDRLHGLFQIGVHAVGRPVVGSRPQ